jgi:hypothetical protein
MIALASGLPPGWPYAGTPARPGRPSSYYDLRQKFKAIALDDGLGKDADSVPPFALMRAARANPSRGRHTLHYAASVVPPKANGN